MQLKKPISLGRFDIQSIRLIEYKRILENSDIQFHLGKRVNVGRFGHNTPSKELFIEESEMDRVKPLLESVDATVDNSRHRFCPNCDGLNIDINKPSGMFRAFKYETYSCRDCDHSWR